ncbi:hypothetical protein [Kribbella sp. HUAS MG21]|uniref:Uncharacterized protein n=1 Tax=Kribbella sp. HUAS MG21 TaxID=3160966 RepID=A0AAU7TJG7_9ACTN
MEAHKLRSMTVDVEPDTGLTHRLHTTGGDGRPWVVLKVGDLGDGMRLYIHDLAVLDALGDVIECARRDLAGALGLLPNGDPCAFVDVFGSIEWNEHDHDRCLEQLLDEPVPFVPVVVAGTEWEAHTDPTVEDNPLDDDDFGDESDEGDDFDMTDRPGGRILRAEGWF